MSFAVASSLDTLTVSGVITDDTNSANVNLTGMSSGVQIVGAGTVIFSNANTYQGTTYVNTGTLQIQNAQALAGAASNGKIQDDIQRLTYFDPSFATGADTGNFTLSYKGHATPLENLATVTAASLQTDLEAAAPAGAGIGIGNVSVTEQSITTPVAGAPTPTVTEFIFTIVFTGTLAGVDVAQLVPVAIDGGTAIVSTVADGGIGTLVHSGAALALNLPAAGNTVTGVALQLNGTGPTGNGALENVNGNAVWQGVNSFAITAASENLTNVTITATTNFQVGQSVLIAGITPAGYDGTFAVTSVTPTTFTYKAAAGLGAATLAASARRRAPLFPPSRSTPAAPSASTPAPR